METQMCRALLLNVGSVLPHALLTAVSEGGRNPCPHFSSDETKGHKEGGAKTQTPATSIPALAHILKPLCQGKCFGFREKDDFLSAYVNNLQPCPSPLSASFSPCPSATSVRIQGQNSEAEKRWPRGGERARNRDSQII